MKAERVFVDTNIFLRYLTNDIKDQADSVEGLLKRAAKGEVSLVTNSLVIAEIIWTLESYYQMPREGIQEKVLAILNTPGLEVSDLELVLQSVTWYVEKKVDYLDAFNAAWVISRGIKDVYTFDRKHFSRLEGITVLVP